MPGVFHFYSGYLELSRYSEARKPLGCFQVLLHVSGSVSMTPGEFVEVARVSDVPIGAVRSVTLGNLRMVLYHTASGFYASDNTCPHRGGPLAEGDLLGEEIVCPWHLWSFDVKTGVNPGNPESMMRTHEVRIEGDKILVRVPQS